MNKKKLWMNFFRILFTRIPVMLSAGLSVIALIAGWALDFTVGFINIIIVILCLLTVGITTQIFLLSSRDIALQAKQELQKNSEQQREEALDNLYNLLKKDSDPRTEKALSDLRELSKAIMESTTEDSRLDAQTRLELMLKVEKLFQKCIHRLEKTLTIWNKAQKLSNKQVKEKLLQLRENIIQEVKKGIIYLGDILTRIQELNYNQKYSQAELDQIRQELEEGLAIAEKIDKNMRKLELGQKELDR